MAYSDREIYDLAAWDALEEFLMGVHKNVEIWGSENCPECESVREYFSRSGYSYTDIQDLVSGEKADVDAMVQLSFQQMRLPLVRIDGEWIEPMELRHIMASEVA